MLHKYVLRLLRRSKPARGLRQRLFRMGLVELRLSLRPSVGIRSESLTRTRLVTEVVRGLVSVRRHVGILLVHMTA